MAFARVNFENPKNGKMREAPIGFSWTTLFFGGIPALLRQHWVWAILQFIIGFFTFGLSGIVFAFIYNNAYAKYLIREGYKATSPVDARVEKKIGMRVPVLEKVAASQ